MKILHLITSLDRGGAENYLSCLTRGQTKDNEVFVIYFKGDGYWSNFLKACGVKTIKLKNFFFVNQIFQIKKFIINNKIQILHCHLSYMEIIGFFSILNNKKIKFIISKHVDNDYLGGSVKQRKTFFSRILSYFIYKRANNIIAISQAVKKYLVENNSILSISKKIKVIYYGIDEFYKNNCIFKIEKTKLNLDKSKVHFCFIGRLVKQKQVEGIIDAYFQLKKEYNNTNLIIVGSGPEKKKLINYCKKLKLDNHINWYPFTEDIGSVLEQIDVLCLNSSFEGLGLILLEAMSLSKPIIAPNVSACPEVVQNNINGYLVEKNSKKSYVEAMIKILDPSIRKKFSSNINVIIKSKFNYEIMLKKTQEIYRL